MNIKLKNIPSNTRLSAQINALIIDKAETDASLLKQGLANMLSLDIEDVEALVRDVSSNKPKKTQYQNILSDVHNAITGDLILDQIDDLSNSIVPGSIHQNAFDQYATYINDLKFEYMILEWEDIRSETSTNTDYNLFKMIKFHELDDFLDRFFTNKEGSTCSHDKTVFVQKQIIQAITKQKTMPLTEYFTNTAHETLNGKKTYWSVDTFKDTDDIINFLSERFYI